MRQQELATLFDFNYWAQRRILATAAHLTDAQFTLRSVIVGRDLRATLVHTLDVECSWRLRLQRRPEEEWRKTLATGADLDPKEQYPVWFYLLHMVTHSQQHRAESAQLLTQLGHSPGDIDFLDYADWARGSAKASR